MNKQAVEAVRTLALRSINCQRLSRSFGACTKGREYRAKAEAYRKSAKAVAVIMGLCKATYA